MSLATKQMEDKLKRRSRLVSLIPGAGPGSGDDDGDGGGDLDLFSQKSECILDQPRDIGVDVDACIRYSEHS